jgi:hypothetical protein
MAMIDFNIDTSDPSAQGGPVSGPNSIARKQALANALLKQGMDSSPAAGGSGGAVFMLAGAALNGSRN